MEEHFPPFIPQPGEYNPGGGIMSRLFFPVVAIGIFCVLAGLAAAFFMHRSPGSVESSAPAQIQSDGSEVLPRAPAAAATPPHQIPKGGRVEREISVTVLPEAHLKLPPSAPGQAALEQACPPVKVDLSLVRMPDQTRRVVASSPDGQVVGGLDVPIESPAIEEPHPWAAGLSYDPIMQTPGAWIERDIWRVRLGAEVNQTRLRIGGPAGTEARIRVGITF